MKKYLFRVSLAVLFSMMVIAVYFGCTTDETATPFDLTGRWTGWGASTGGAGRAELVITQDSTGNITGVVYTYDEKTDTVPFTGTLSDDHFTGVLNGHCPADINMDLKNDGVKLEGTAIDRPGADCGDTTDLLFYKVLPATENVAGSWTGTHNGAEGSGNFTMVLNQLGSPTVEIVQGNLYDESDTLAVMGSVIGNIFEGIIEDQNCPIFILMEVNGNNMNGKFVQPGDSQGGCLDRGTVTASRLTGKRYQK